jgi:rhodanese-related sulfurtransferase
MKNLKLLSLLLLQFSIFASCNSNPSTSTISVDEFEKGIAQNDIQLLDGRTAEEYQNGHIKDALQANWNNQSEFKDRISALDKDKPIYIYCLSGGRSNAAMQWLSANGYAKIYNLSGGINAWKQANKEIEGAPQVEQISLEDFLNSIPKDKTVLVDIGAKWCPPCKKMQPIIDSLEKENYNIIKVDGGVQTNLCKQLKVDAFPTFIMYKNGVEINRKQGLTTKEELISLFN